MMIKRINIKYFYVKPLLLGKLLVSSSENPNLKRSLYAWRKYLQFKKLSEGKLNMLEKSPEPNNKLINKLVKECVENNIIVDGVINRDNLKNFLSMVIINLLDPKTEEIQTIKSLILKGDNLKIKDRIGEFNSDIVSWFGRVIINHFNFQLQDLEAIRKKFRETYEECNDIENGEKLFGDIYKEKEPKDMYIKEEREILNKINFWISKSNEKQIKNNIKKDLDIIKDSVEKLFYEEVSDSYVNHIKKILC